MLKAIIFDCDGVLINSEQANMAYYERIFAALGAQHLLQSSAARQLCHTAASQQVFAELLPADRQEEAFAVAAQIDFTELVPLLTPEEGIQGLLAGLYSRYKLAVATNRGASTRPVLANLGLEAYFDDIVTCLDVPDPKPAPDVVAEACRRLQVSGCQALYIGDSHGDGVAARGAGVRFAAYRLAAEADCWQLNHHEELWRFLEAG